MQLNPVSMGKTIFGFHIKSHLGKYACVGMQIIGVFVSEKIRHVSACVGVSRIPRHQQFVRTLKNSLCCHDTGPPKKSCKESHC